MSTFEWISIDDPRKPDLDEGEEFSDDILVLVCKEHLSGKWGYWWELGTYCRGGDFLRRDDPVGCVIRYWAPLLVPPFPPKDRIPADRAAVKAAFKADREECQHEDE